jgi:DNA polymerase/3'-5' exonuclease PolX
MVIQSLNKKIIIEFERLIKFIQLQINDAIEKNNKKEETVNSFRQKQLKNALYIIKKYPQEISFDNIKEFGKLGGIGKGTISRIEEILKTGKLSELKNYKDDPNEKIIEELETIIGVGRTTAIQFVKAGVKSIKDLKKKINKGEIEVNEKILLGIKYHGKFFDNIPHEEITKINKIFQKIINKMNKEYKLNDKNKYILEICGSYRREKPVSGDIDVLITKLDVKMDHEESINHLERFIKITKNPLKSNNNEPLLVDDITDKHYETKYMGFLKYKDNPVRRVDIRFVPYDAWFSALQYFTGSQQFNIKLRNIAKQQGYKLSEYGLFDKDGKHIPIKSEYDIFKILNVEYLPPNLR